MADQAALRGFYDENVGPVFRFIRARVGDTTAAEDLSQETWLRVARTWGSPGVEPGRAWVFTIARNLITDRWRKLGREPERVQHHDREPGHERTEAVVTGTRVMEVLADLRDDEGNALILRYVAGMSVAEVGEALGRSTKGAEALLTRAKKHFVDEWEVGDDA